MDVVAEPKSSDQPFRVDVDPKTGVRRVTADADADDVPADTTADSGVQGGVDEPNEGVDGAPTDDD
jgi:hypothetical protein